MCLWARAFWFSRRTAPGGPSGHPHPAGFSSKAATMRSLPMEPRCCVRARAQTSRGGTGLPTLGFSQEAGPSVRTRETWDPPCACARHAAMIAGQRLLNKTQRSLP